MRRHNLKLDGIHLQSSVSQQIHQSVRIKDKLFFHVKAPEAMLPKNPKGKKKEPKGTTTPPPQTRPVATPVRPGQVQSSSVPSPQGASGNPALQKRQRGKQPDPDKDRQIEELKKAWGNRGGVTPKSVCMHGLM